MTEHVLEVLNLSKSFGARKAVDNVSFKVESGDVFGFLGPNGAGKTTSIRMMLGLIHPDSGRVKISGYDLKEEFLQAIAGVGAVVETPKFYSYLSGYENLQLIANLHPNLPKNRVEEVLEMVGLRKRSGDKAKTYSLGMKQRLGLARALLNNPKLIFLDEPTNGLDPQGMKEIREMISQLALERDITFFVTSHLLHEVEQICNKAAILKEGRLIAQSTVKEMLNMDNETLEVYTTETERADEVLKEAGFVKSVSTFSKGLCVELDRGCSGKLIKLLVSQNVTVEYLMPKNKSLEQFFIDLTEGGEQIA